MVSKKKIGEVMTGIGFFGMLISASGIDGPGNDPVIVYSLIAANITIMAIGATLGDLWA